MGIERAKTLKRMVPIRTLLGECSLELFFFYVIGKERKHDTITKRVFI